MSFFEDIASALDADGIESRVKGDTMFVPITREVEIQFVEIDPDLPAANVYIAAADVDEDDDDFEAVLVSVAFSVDDAVSAVARHVATDQVVTVLRDLLDGTDERIADLEFVQDWEDPNLVTAEVGQHSEIQVLVESEGDVPVAMVTFAACGESYEDLVDQAIVELWESGADEDLSEDDRNLLIAAAVRDAELASEEVLELGSFTDFDRLFDVLALAAEQAADWEAQLVPIDDYQDPDDDEEDEDYLELEEVFDEIYDDEDEDLDIVEDTP
ncbi:hypothetical protein [Corynebacterium freiburgense]|uniref:hypothetical protein n=1 Tax=Corynebacterium freiburgense TaxID=556548 RepID=UPI00047E789D|nr:hypothetical protein [Corynebacterium freiburgense]